MTRRLERLYLALPRTAAAVLKKKKDSSGKEEQKQTQNRQWHKNLIPQQKITPAAKSVNLKEYDFVLQAYS